MDSSFPAWMLLLSPPAAAIAAGGAYTWAYNRYLAALRESYLKKAAALGLVPGAVLAGVAHAAAMLAVGPGFVADYLYWSSLACIAVAAGLIGRRAWAIGVGASLSRGIVRLDAGFPDLVNYPRFHPLVRLVLRAISPINGATRLEIVEVPATVPGLDPGFDGFRLVHLTDFHVHPALRPGYFRRVVREALAAKPDAILLGGDLVSRRQHLDDAAAVLAGLRRHPLVLGVRGNHDFWTRPSRAAEVLAEVGCQLLSNEVFLVRRGSASLAIVGIEDPYIPFTLAGLAAMRAAAGAAPMVALVHTPEAFPVAARVGAAFAVAGHTHGGQVRLPFFGTTLAGCAVPSNQADGRGRLGRMGTFTSRGIGAFFPLRYRCAPQLVVLVLRAGATSSLPAPGQRPT